MSEPETLLPFKQKQSLAELLLKAQEFTMQIVEAEGNEDLKALRKIEEEYFENAVNIADKVDQIAFVHDQLDWDAAGFERKAELYARIAKSLHKSREYLRERLKQTMLAMGTPKLGSEDNLISISKSKPKVLVPEVMPPKDWDDAKKLGFIRTKTTEDIDKITLREALENGADIPWAKLEDVFTLRITPNKSSQKKLK